MKKRDYKKPPRVCVKIANLIYRDNIFDELYEKGLFEWDDEQEYGKYVYEGVILDNFEIVVNYIDHYNIWCKLRDARENLIRYKRLKYIGEELF
jgi:hypothetical protein